MGAHEPGPAAEGGAPEWPLGAAAARSRRTARSLLPSLPEAGAHPLGMHPFVQRFRGAMSPGSRRRTSDAARTELLAHSPPRSSAAGRAAWLDGGDEWLDWADHTGPWRPPGAGDGPLPYVPWDHHGGGGVTLARRPGSAAPTSAGASPRASPHRSTAPHNPSYGPAPLYGWAPPSQAEQRWEPVAAGTGACTGVARASRRAPPPICPQTVQS